MDRERQKLMASAVVKFVLDKLCKMISNEVHLLGGVKDQVILAERELRNIRNYLIVVESRGTTLNAQAENWLSDLHDVAHRMEDAIDTFHLELEDKSCKENRGLLNTLKSMSLKPTKVPSCRKLGKELHSIQQELDRISESKNNYAIDPLQAQDQGSGAAVDLNKRRAAYPDVDEKEVVGLGAARDDVIELLNITPEASSSFPQERKIEDAELKRYVITIVGPGGLEKTTLARMVYRSARASFNFHTMLGVSQHFTRNGILRKMLSKLDNSALERCKDEEDIIETLIKLLSMGRYLIILDDVWDKNVWEQLRDALPDVGNGSRVLMTSRDRKVAESADYPRIYDLKLLDPKKSLELLLKKAGPYQTFEECPANLHDIANDLSKKCKGLPLALIVLGGLLSTKRDYSAWDRVLRTMNWSMEGEDCMNVLKMSYDYMPYELKQCFLYLASFLEDYEIHANRLIRMWVAEGFIPQENNKTIEEKAEDYLELLFQRCMIQEAKRSPNRLVIKSFKVHDIIRELAIDQAGEKKFLTAFPKARGVNQSRRRVSLQSCDAQLMEYVGPNTRTLISFDNLPKYFEFRLLRVLEIVNVRVPDGDRIQLKGLDNLIHLKYLGFRKCENLYLGNCKLGRLKNLETLDLRSIWPTLEEDLWDIGTLRHVYVDDLWAITELPSKADDLSNLQTLKWVSTSACHKHQLPGLTNLQNLGLTTLTGKHTWDGVPRLLETLSSLISLRFRVNVHTCKDDCIPEKIVYPTTLPKYENLRILELWGQWSEGVTLEASLFPEHLVKLKLGLSKLRQDPMPELGKLKDLKKLELEYGVYEGERMTCPEGFPVLQTLLLVYSQVFEVSEGVMPKLKYLIKFPSVKLEVPSYMEKVVVSNF